MLTDSYLKAAAAHDREVEDRAPYNQPDGDIDLTYCSVCGRDGTGDLQRHYAHEEDGRAMKAAVLRLRRTTITPPTP